MPHPTLLQQLNTSEAITDALYRAVLAFDTNDAKLFQSAWAKDNATFNRNGQLIKGMDAIMQNIFGVVAKLETHHCISNIRIRLEDDTKTAHMTTHMIAQHHREGEGMDPSKKGLIGGTLNTIDLVFDSEADLWKMTSWDMKITWIDGDASIVGLPGH